MFRANSERKLEKLLRELYPELNRLDGLLLRRLIHELYERLANWTTNAFGQLDRTAQKGVVCSVVCTDDGDYPICLNCQHMDHAVCTRMADLGLKQEGDTTAHLIDPSLLKQSFYWLVKECPDFKKRQGSRGQHSWERCEP